MADCVFQGIGSFHLGYQICGHRVVHNLRFFFFYKFIFIYLFLAALGLRCCTQAFSSCGERGLLFVAVCRLLIEVASLVVDHGL